MINKETHIVICSLKGMDLIDTRMLWTKFSSSIKSLGALNVKHTEYIDNLYTKNVLGDCILFVDNNSRDYNRDVYIVETKQNELYLFVDLEFETLEEVTFRPDVFIHMGQHFNRYLEEFQHEICRR